LAPMMPIIQRADYDRGAVISHLVGNHGIVGPRQVGRERSTGTSPPAFRTPSAQEDGHHDNVRSEATRPALNGVPSGLPEIPDDPARIWQVRCGLHILRYGTPWIDEVHENLSCHKTARKGVLHGQDCLGVLAVPQGSGALGFVRPLPGAALNEQQQDKAELATTGSEPCKRHGSAARVSRPFAGRPEGLSPESAPHASEAVALPERWDPTVCRRVTNHASGLNRMAYVHLGAVRSA
jgi:hypothetical protein